MHRRIPKTGRHKNIKNTDPLYKTQATAVTKRHVKEPTAEQSVPRSIKDIIVAQEQLSQKRKRSKRKKDKKPDEFVRRKGENDRDFLWRVQRETDDFVQEHSMKAKYDLLDNAVLGLDDVKPLKASKSVRRKEPLENMASTSTVKALNQNQNQSKRPNTRKGRRKRKRETDELNRKDIVLFGERVDAPPNITVLPRKVVKTDTARPGKKPLLLKAMFDEPMKMDKVGNLRRYENDGTIKCDDKQMQEELTKERQRVIEAYRTMKATQNKS